MTIDADVRGVAAHFGVDARLIQAVCNAEGNILRAVQCSIPSVQTREKALDVTCRSAVHAMSDFLKARGLQREFVDFWQQRWAPTGVANDPTNLNANWSSNVKKFLGVAVALACCVWAAAAEAQTTPHPDVVATTKSGLQARGVDLSGPCGAEAITARVAWTLRSEGAGLLDKPSGNNCQGRAVDIIIYPDGHAFDILTDAGGSNGPSWSPIDPVDASRWRAPTDPGDSAPSSPPPTVPVDITPRPVSDLSQLPALVDALRIRLDLVIQAQHAIETIIVEQDQQIKDQNERIYADETNQRTAQTATIIAAVDSPGWFRSVIGNRYVQLAIVGLGSYAATHQMMKP